LPPCSFQMERQWKENLKMTCFSCGVLYWPSELVAYKLRGQNFFRGFIAKIILSPVIEEIVH
jgi:hypothetical protein